jgi:hypothetical protein
VTPPRHSQNLRRQNLMRVAAVAISFVFAHPSDLLSHWRVAAGKMAEGPQTSAWIPKKLIYLVFKWGWRGPVALALVIFGIWLFSELTN